jgi:Na+-driven multidrug efflux pump
LCIFAYWVVGFTFAYTFGVSRGEGPVFVWIGLNVGLTISAIALVARYLFVTRRRIDGTGQPPLGP